MSEITPNANVDAIAEVLAAHSSFTPLWPGGPGCICGWQVPRDMAEDAVRAGYRAHLAEQLRPAIHGDKP